MGIRGACSLACCGIAVFWLVQSSPLAQTLPIFTPQEVSQIARSTVAQDIALSPKGGWIYIIGSTTAPDYPVTADAFDRTCGTDGNCNVVQGRFGPERRADVVLTVFDATGQMRYSTFLGGAGHDDNPRLAITRNGTVWLAGSTNSPIFEQQSATCIGTTWIARFDAALRTLEGFRCLSGLVISDIALDAQETLWVLGSASAPNLATSNAWQRQIAGQIDIFVAQFERNNISPRVATYIGGRGLDTAGHLAVTPSGALAIVGSTNSHDFPAVRAVKSVFADSVVDRDAVVVLLDRSAQFAHFSTYWGGNADESGAGVAVDAEGNLFVTGHARSANMPATPDAVDTRCGSDGACDRSLDTYVTKFSPTGSVLASTFYGGSALDSGRAVATVVNGRVVILGNTQSPDFPLVDAVPSRRVPAINAEHSFFAVLDDRLSRVVRSSFVLDDQYLPNVPIMTVGNGHIYVAGQVSTTTGLPTGIGTYLRVIRLPQ